MAVALIGRVVGVIADFRTSHRVRFVEHVRPLMLAVQKLSDLKKILTSGDLTACVTL
jgi:hypothetical protein